MSSFLSAQRSGKRRILVAAVERVHIILINYLLPYIKSFKSSAMERDDVIKNVRACLISSKGGVKIDDLNKDYKMLIDKSIPYWKFGCGSLGEFLRTVPGIRMSTRGSECYVEAMPTSESAHISNLIARQKTGSKKPKKLMNTHKSTPSRHPMMTRSYNPATRINNYAPYSQIIGRQNIPVPAMSTKITIYQNNDRPRYIQPNFGVPPTSPSKRLNDRQTNLVVLTNQSVIKPRDDSHLQNNEKVTTSVINQKPKTVNNNMEILPKGKASSLSERLKATPTLPSLLNLPTSISPPQQSEVLSPLSPGQVLADYNNKPYQHSPVITSTPVTNRKFGPKSQPLDPRDELQRKASALSLPDPVYQICPMVPNKNAKERTVYARVKVGPHSYSNYPDDARTEDEAKKMAARLALQDLTEKYGSPFTLNETKDRHIIRDRVLFIVDAHPSGIFMHQVPIYYKQQYRETLPKNWEKIIEECTAIVVEKGVDNSIILRRYVPPIEPARETTPSKTPDKVQLHPIGRAEPGQLELPDDVFWIVYVTCVISTVEVWGRIVGDSYSDEFDIMTSEMAQHYGKIQQSTKSVLIEIGNYYVVFEDDSWHRVCCIDYDSATGIATVSFIDHGDADSFHHSKLHVLEKQFCVLPAQALRMCFSGLEDFGDCDSIQTEIEKLILDRALYVEIVNRDEKDNDGPFITGVFYDTHGQHDINLNSELSKQILQQIVVAPTFDVAGQVSEVFISHVEEDGDVFVQVQSESMKILVSLLNRLVSTGLNDQEVKNCAVTTVDVSKTYFVCVNNNWYRGKIVTPSDNTYNQLSAFLIDFGKTVITTKENLLSLERLSEILAKFPAQALKVHLDNIDKSMFNEAMVARLTELAPKGEPLLVKVVSPGNEAPVVELFKRIQPSNMLVSINNTLTLEDELARSHGDGNNNTKPRKRLERANSRLVGTEGEEVKLLKPPKISGIGEYFDVHVSMAAHPGNFTIQPFDDKRSLETMMMQLQETCRAYKGPVPTVETIREGKLYAAKHTDGNWYRVCVSGVMKEQMVSVYFCDFGDVSVLPLDKLQPLKSQFLELPYQAIKARLAGIQPVNRDWTVEDSMWFQDMVVEKNFVSIVVESKSDGLTPAETVLGLKLVDVKTSEDIYIDRLLVEEGRAKFVD